MQAFKRINKKDTIWIFLIVIEIAVLCYNLNTFFPYTPDDAFIYQYGARQISRGIIPNMTPGELPTNSFSSYPWMVILSFAYIIEFDPIIWAKLLGTFFTLIAVWFIAAIIKHLTVKNYIESLALGGFILALPPLAGCAVNGLETAFAGFTLVLTIWAIVRDVKDSRFHFSTGLYISFHIINRPDAFIDGIVFFAGILWLVYSRKMLFRDLLRIIGGFIPTLVVFIALWITYDMPLPLTAYVKMPVTANPDLIGRSIDLLSLFVSDLLYDPILILIFLSVIAFAIINRKKPVELMISGLALTHTFVFLVASDWMGLHRLYMPSIFVAIIPFILLMEKCLKKQNAKQVLVAVMVFLLPASNFSWRSMVALHYFKDKAPSYWLAKIIENSKLPDSWMMTDDMGVIPYFADIPAIDSHDYPICNRYRAKNENSMEYILSHNLDFIIIKTYMPDPERETSNWVNFQVRHSRWFKENYRYVGTATWRPRIPGAVRRGLLNMKIGGGSYYNLYVSQRIDRIPQGKTYQFLETYR